MPAGTAAVEAAYTTGCHIRGRMGGWIGGATTFERGRGNFDPANAEAVEAGCERGSKRGGATCGKQGRGIFEPAKAKGAMAKSGKTRASTTKGSKQREGGREGDGNTLCL